MKTWISLTAVAGMLWGATPRAVADDEGWATTGKILTGLMVGHALSHALTPHVHEAPVVYVTPPPAPVYVPPAPVVVTVPPPRPVVVAPPPLVCVPRPVPIYRPPVVSFHFGFGPGHGHDHYRYPRGRGWHGHRPHGGRH